jgi:hypothetical protein
LNQDGTSARTEQSVVGSQGISSSQVANGSPGASLDNQARDLMLNLRTSAVGGDLTQGIGPSQQTANQNNNVLNTPNINSPQTTDNVLQNTYPNFLPKGR